MQYTLTKGFGRSKAGKAAKARDTSITGKNKITGIFKWAGYVIAGLYLILAIGCNQSSEKVDETPVVKDYEYFVNLLKNAPPEDLDDPKQWEGYRIEFTHYMNSTQAWIFSMKTDGTDVRKVLGPEDLDPGNGDYDVFEKRMRSPNNRYLFVNIDPTNLPPKNIIFDLKEKKKIYTEEGPKGGRPAAYWTSDSKVVQFYGKHGMVRFHIETGELKKIKTMIPGMLVRPLPNGNYLSVLNTDYLHLSPQKKILGSYRYDRSWPQSIYSLSPSERLLRVSNYETCVYNLTTTEREAEHCLVGFSPQDTDLTDQGIWGGYKGKEFSGLSFYSFASREVTNVWPWAAGPRGVKIINRQIGYRGEPDYHFLKDD